MADKLRTQQELERLQAKYIGTGHPDTSGWEFRTNVHRDTFSSIVGHQPLLSYVALAENEAIVKLRAKFIRVSHILFVPTDLLSLVDFVLSGKRFHEMYRLTSSS